jgi:hypothetical protein
MLGHYGLGILWLPRCSQQLQNRRPERVAVIHAGELATWLYGRSRSRRELPYLGTSPAIVKGKGRSLTHTGSPFSEI